MTHTCFNEQVNTDMFLLFVTFFPGHFFVIEVPQFPILVNVSAVSFELLQSHTIGIVGFPFRIIHAGSWFYKGVA